MALKIAILNWMQLLNNIIKSEHDFKTPQKYYKFNVSIKTLKNFWTALKPCLNLMPSFKISSGWELQFFGAMHPRVNLNSFNKYEIFARFVWS